MVMVQVVVKQIHTQDLLGIFLVGQRAGEGQETRIPYKSPHKSPHHDVRNQTCTTSVSGDEESFTDIERDLIESVSMYDSESDASSDSGHGKYSHHKIASCISWQESELNR